MTDAGNTPTAWVDELKSLILAGRFAEAEGLVAARRADGPPPAQIELALRQRWGMTLLEAGDTVGAEAQLRAAAALVPEDPEALADVAFAQLRGGRHADAVPTLERVLALDPRHRGARTNLASALMALKRYDAAEGAYRDLLRENPADAAAQRNLGILLVRLERHEEALASADAALALGPSPVALGVRASALLALDRFDAALEASRQAIAAGGDRYENLTRMGMALSSLGRVEEALGVLDEAQALRPEGHLAPYRRAMVRLKRGDFAGGWQDYEARWRDEPFLTSAAGAAARSLAPSFRLDATREALAGRRVLVVAEQGIGDEIMFASALPDLARLAGEVTCLTEPRLVRLFSASMPGVNFRGRGEADKAGSHDVVLPIGSLGRLFRNRPEEFPGTAYLHPSPASRARWADRLGSRRGGLRIGLSWRGGTSRTRLSQRSMPLSDLLAGLPGGHEYVSLQYGEVGPEVEAVRAAGQGAVRVFPTADIDDFDDLAGLVANLDLVVSVQTALVHLAGGLGKPTLVLAPWIAEWRYMAAGETMPWYGSVRVLRQPARGAWPPVLQAARAAIEATPPAT